MAPEVESDSDEDPYAVSSDEEDPEQVRFEPVNFPMPEGVGSAVGKPLPAPDPNGEEPENHIYAKARLVADKRLEGRVEKDAFIPLPHIGHLKQKANELFQDGSYEEAQGHYEDAGSLLIRDFFKFDKGVETEHVQGSDGYDEGHQLLQTSFLNSCMCLLKMADAAKGNPDMQEGMRRRCVWHAKIAMAKNQASNAKALYRRGVARTGLREWRMAIYDLTKAAKLEPKNRGIRDALNNVYKAREAEKLREKESFTFDKLAAAIHRKERQPKKPPPGKEFDHLDFLRAQQAETEDI